MGQNSTSIIAYVTLKWVDNSSKIENVMAELTQIVPSKNIYAYMQTKNKLTDRIVLLIGWAKVAICIYRQTTN